MLFTLWCTVWPVMLALSCVRGDVVSAVVAIVVVSLTPIAAFALFRQEKRNHEDCHVAFDAAMKTLTASTVFHIHEARANELDMIAQAISEAPPNLLVDPQTLASSIDARVSFLRQAAPVRPVSIMSLLHDEEDDESP
jgi:hypothetical protein